MQWQRALPTLSDRMKRHRTYVVIMPMEGVDWRVRVAMVVGLSTAHREQEGSCVVCLTSTRRFLVDVHAWLQQSDRR